MESRSAVTTRKHHNDVGRYLIALVEITGGLGGFWMILGELASIISVLPIGVIFIFFAIASVFLSSIVAGFFVLFNSKFGYVLSIFVQLPQVVAFTAGHMRYRIHASGLSEFDLILKNNSAEGWQFGIYAVPVLSPFYSFSTKPQTDFVIAINLIAVSIIIWILYGVRQEKITKDQLLS